VSPPRHARAPPWAFAIYDRIVHALLTPSHFPMTFSISAGGPPDTTRSVIADQLNAQLGAEPPAERKALADAVLAYVDAELATVDPSGGDVSVSGSVYIGIAKSQPFGSAPPSEAAADPVAG
jgi:hypothetical protein